MKKILAIIFICLALVDAKAQMDSNYVELGLNTIRLLTLRSQSDAFDYDVWNPYLLTAEFHYKRLGLRVGGNMQSFSEKELPVPANGMSSKLAENGRNDFRVGLLWEIPMNPRWTYKVGVDYYMASYWSRNKTEFTNEDDQTVITELNSETDESGFAPFAYIQFHITPKVSLGSELLWRIGNYKRTELDSNNLNDAPIEKKFEGSKRVMMAPTAFFINVRF